MTRYIQLSQDNKTFKSNAIFSEKDSQNNAKPCSNAPQRKNFKLQNCSTHYNLNNAQLVTNDPVTCQNNQANNTVDKPKEQTNHH